MYNNLVSLAKANEHLHAEKQEIQEKYEKLKEEFEHMKKCYASGNMENIERFLTEVSSCLFVYVKKILIISNSPQREFKTVQSSMQKLLKMQLYLRIF